MKMSTGMDHIIGGIPVCESCVITKMTRITFKGTRKRARKVLELVHSDVCGPSNINSYDGKRYFATFIDDFTHVVVTYSCLKGNSKLIQNIETQKT